MSESSEKLQYGILSGKIDKLCLLPLSINVPFVTGFVPSIARSMAIKDIKEVKRKSKIFIAITTIIAIPSTIGMIIFAPLILKVLFPNASSGVLLLRINSISIFFSLFAQTINSILQAIGKNNIPVISSFVGVMFKLISNIILIKNQYIGINGAAIGNIICNLVVLLVSLGFLLHNFRKK